MNYRSNRFLKQVRNEIYGIIFEREAKMVSHKYFWYFLMIGALVLWACAVALYFLFPTSDYKAVLLIALLIVHCGEIPYTLKLLKGKLSPVTIAAKTFLFGFTWWLPFNKGIVKG
jgi:hypothetical protein